jgi:PAS domain S-box-containing protein
MDARRGSTHRADIAATGVRDSVAQAATLVDGVRRFLAGQESSGVTAQQFADIGANWLGPVGLPAAAWVERVPADERVSYERRTGHRIVVLSSSGGLVRAGLRKTYLPATLVSQSPPLSAPGIDLGGTSWIAAAVARPQAAYRVRATSLGQLPDGTTGLFLVQSAQRLNRGIVEPGFVLLFLPASWLLAGAADTGASSPRLQITVGGGSTGDVGGAATRVSTFAAAGQRFEVRVPRRGVHGAAEVLPWMILAGGLLLAALAGALGVIAARRAKAKAEVDRLFTLSPDLIVVADFDGFYRRVNPAFEARLGYTEQEALSRPYVEFVHPDDRERTDARRKELVAGEATMSFENRYVCKNGSYRWIEWTATPVLAERLTYAVGRDVTERRQAETDLREAEERNRTLAEEQAALRRVATLVAEGATDATLFAAVAREVAHVLDVGMVSIDRYESDAYSTVVASLNDPGFPVGSRWPLDGPSLGATVLETGRPSRVDDYEDLQSTSAAAIRDASVRSTVGVPIVVDGKVWGVICVGTLDPGPLAGDTEERLARFTELVATGIADAESRAALARLANQQAALRRVATLVAEGVSPAEVFSALCEEVTLLVDAEASVIGRLEADGQVTVVAVSGMVGDEAVLGTQFGPDADTVIAAVLKTGRSARKDDYGDASEPARRLGIRSGVGVPIVVEGALWGIVAIGTVRERFPDDTGHRLEEFTALAATAIANAESRSELAASRARIVAAADETRRRIERDLHDGTQQRLVSLSLELRLAESTASSELGESRSTIRRVADELNGVIDELREISRGIHPAVLSEGGLGPALRTLARRSAIPVVLGGVIEHRLPEPVEVAAYYVVSEALTNAAKHANASRVDVEADVRDSSLRLSIRDDGVGGANAAGGSGLIGLRDRVEALGGSIEIESPPGEGTRVAVRLPLELDLTPDEPREPRSAATFRG